MIGDKIKEIRKNAGMTQKEFAEVFGLSDATINQWESGNRAPQNEALVLMVEKYNINLNWLLTGSGEMYYNGAGKQTPGDGRVKMVELLSAKAAAGSGIECYDIAVVDMVPVPAKVIEPYPEGRVKAMVVRGDSMTPTIFNGDYVLYVPGEVQDNGIYVIDVFGELRCKRLEFKLNGDITVMSDNERYDKEFFVKSNDTLRICGKVVGWIHKHNY